MKHLSPLPCALLLLGASGLSGSPTYSRTWVSARTGADTAACGLVTTPCLTFAVGASHTASGGEMDALDAGEYGAVSLTQSITIDGGPGVAAVTSSIGCAGMQAGICVFPTGVASVTLRNITVNVSFPANSVGIQLYQPGTPLNVNMENLSISSPTGNCVINAGASLVIRDSNIRDCASSGINTSGSAPVTLENVVITNADFGLDVTTPSNDATVTLHNCNLSQNFIGIVATTGVVQVDSTTLSRNGLGISVSQFSVVQISNVTVTGNNTGLLATGPATIVSFVNNRISGNANNGAPTSSVYQK